MMGTNRQERYPYPNQGSHPYPNHHNFNTNAARPPRQFPPRSAAPGRGSQYYPYQHPQQFYPPPPPPRPPRPPHMLNLIPPGDELAPPGTSESDSLSTNSSLPPPSLQQSGTIPPLAPPPLPPLFPYLSPELAYSLEQGASQCGQSFEKESSDLPFVPIIINASDLKKMTEMVKTQTEESKGTDLLKYDDIFDSNMPQDLRRLFQPLYCKLCKLQLSSPIVARDHYKGKKHKKAEQVWYLSNPKKANPNRVGNFSNSHGSIMGSVNSNNQSNSRGESGHQAIVYTNISTPAHRGFRTVQGYFDRKRPAPPLMETHVESSNTNKLQEFIPAYRAALAAPRKKRRKEGGGGSSGGPNFAFCEVCQISLTSQVHADQHYNGKNHKQKLVNGRKSEGDGFTGEDPFAINESFTIGEPFIQS